MSRRLAVVMLMVMAGSARADEAQWDADGGAILQAFSISDEAELNVAQAIPMDLVCSGRPWDSETFAFAYLGNKLRWKCTATARDASAASATACRAAIVVSLLGERKRLLRAGLLDGIVFQGSCGTYRFAGEFNANVESYNLAKNGKVGELHVVQTSASDVQLGSWRHNLKWSALTLDTSDPKALAVALAYRVDEATALLASIDLSHPGELELRVPIISDFLTDLADDARALTGSGDDAVRSTTNAWFAFMVKQLKEGDLATLIERAKNKGKGKGPKTKVIEARLAKATAAQNTKLHAELVRASK